MEKEIKYSVRQFFDYHFEYNVGTGLSKKRQNYYLKKRIV